LFSTNKLLGAASYAALIKACAKLGSKDSFSIANSRSALMVLKLRMAIEGNKKVSLASLRNNFWNQLMPEVF